MKPLLDLKFVFVIGKGGVGKSAVSAALALTAAARGKRVLVAMCNTKERLSYLLGTAPIGPQIKRIAPNIDAVNMEPAAALEEYGMMTLKVRALYKVIFENRFVAAFLRGTPGMDAWAMLGKAQYHAFEKDASGRDRYDMVILDAPATGHGLELLRVPKVIVSVAPPGPLRKEAERAWELFCDPQRAGVLLVTLPEEMPVNETLELDTALRTELGLPVAGLVVNQVMKEVFGVEDSALLEKLRAVADESSPLRTHLESSHARAEREDLQRACLERLRTSVRSPQLLLPMILGPDFHRPEVQQLATALGDGLKAAVTAAS